MPRTRSISPEFVRSMALLVLCSVLLWTGRASALPLAHHDGKHDVKHEIEQLEERWRTAQLAGDTATLDKMLSDDYVGITISGQVNTKSQQLDRVRKRVFVLTRLDLSDVKVKLLGEVAIVTVLARVEGSNEEKRINGNFRYTRIYQHLPSGQWKITNFEATRIPPKHDDLAQSHQ